MDGIIANGLDNALLSSHLSSSSTPLVVIGARSSDLQRRMTNLVFVRNDDTGSGRFGADYLSSLGRARSYGFVDWTATGYASMLRREGFLEYFKGKDTDVRTYSTTADLEKGSLEDITSLSKWLSSLPKPTAVMAVHDLRAIHVLEAAAMSGIKIPRELALIGVDNDELLCDTAEPTLTSIAPDHIHLGELAAEALNGMMREPSRHRTRTIRSNVKTIVERQSAKPVTPATQLVERAMSFIRRNAVKGISTSDVVSHLGVSRRLADTRFRQFTGQSILAAILNTRLAEVKRRLRDTVYVDGGLRRRAENGVVAVHPRLAGVPVERCRVPERICRTRHPHVVRRVCNRTSHRDRRAKRTCRAETLAKAESQSRAPLKHANLRAVHRCSSFLLCLDWRVLYRKSS